MDLPNTRLWRDPSRPKASSPLIVIPIAPSVPSCSKPSRCGLARAEHAAMLARRPTLTAPARAGVSEAQIGTKKLVFKSNKKTDGERKMRRAETPCTKNAPYKACSAFTRVTACTLALSPYFVTRFPKASAISSPPQLLRLLPAGAFAGWDLHPLESAALSRRTPEADISQRYYLEATWRC
jgi:hypothetical protein